MHMAVDSNITHFSQAATSSALVTISASSFMEKAKESGENFLNFLLPNSAPDSMLFCSEARAQCCLPSWALSTPFYIPGLHSAAKILCFKLSFLFCIINFPLFSPQHLNIFTSSKHNYLHTCCTYVILVSVSRKA